MTVVEDVLDDEGGNNRRSSHRKTELAESIERETFLAAVFECAPIPYAVFDAAGRPVQVNPAYCAMFGAAPPPEYNLHTDTVLGPVGRSFVERAYGGERVELPVFWYDPRDLVGVHVPTGVRRAAFSCTLFPIRAADHSVSHLVIAYRDVTAELDAKENLERREAEAVRASRDRYRGFIHLSSEGIWRLETGHPISPEAPVETQFDSLRRHAYIAECNDALARMHGFSGAREMKGVRLCDLLARPGARWSQHLHSFLRGEFRLDNVAHTEIDPHGRARHFMTSLTGVIEGGCLVRAWGIQRDITEQHNAEDALQRMQEHLRLIFDANIAGLVRSDDHGRVIDANDAFLSIIGYSREDLQAGRVRWDQMTPPDWQHADQRALDSLRARGVAPQFEKEYFRKDGTRVPVIIGSARIWSQQQNVSFVIDASQQKAAEARAEAERDEQRRQALRLEAALSEQRKTAKALQMQSEAMENSLNAFDIVDAKGNFIYVNRTYLKMWGYSSLEEVRGTPASSHCVDPAIPGKIIRALKESGECTIEFLARRKDGSTFHVHMWARAALDADGNEVYPTTSIDITEQKIAEERLHQAIRIRDEFLSVASHELKTPLTTLRLQADIRRRALARGDISAFSPERLQKMVEGDTRQIDRIARLIDDMLDISRITTGKLTLHLEAFDLGEMVEDVLARLRPQLERASTKTSFHRKNAVVGRWDRFRIEQAFINLLTNAMKYGQHAPVEVEVFAAGNDASLVVRDHGAGISSEDQERIFERFERAVSANEVSGLGLGLHIVREVARMHGGTINVRSSAGAGAEFTLRLPLISAEA